MEGRDYYSILGVQRGASAEEIRKAYRALARQYHPDVNTTPDAQRRFTEIQEAYDVLSDDERRREYDAYGRVGSAPGWKASGRAGAGANAGQGFDVDLDDLGSMFDAFFGARAGQPRPGPSARRAARPSRPATVEQDIHVTFDTMAGGGVHPLSLERAGTTQRLEIKIPKGVPEGTKLRVRPGSPNEAEVVVTVHVGQHPHFRRVDPKGLDLELDLPLNIAEAALGAAVAVPTLEDRVEVTVPPGTASGKKLRLRGKGLSDEQGRAGDLYAVVRIVPPDPEALSAAQRKALESLARDLPSPRQGKPW